MLTVKTSGSVSGFQIRNCSVLLKPAILAILFKNYLQGAKNMRWLFPQLYKNSTDCFVLQHKTISESFVQLSKKPPHVFAPL